MIQEPGDRSDQAGWAVRPAGAGDTGAIVSLLNQVYGRWGQPDHWRWKYLDPPAPFRPPSAVAEVDGQIVGHFGILPVEAVNNGQTIRAGQTVDAAVLPAFRRRGIHSGLGRLVLDGAAGNGISLVYAFPGLYSIGIDQRIGYRTVAFVPELLQVLAPWQALRLALACLPGDLLALWRWRRSQEWPAETVRRLARLRRSLLLLLGWLSAPAWPRKPAALAVDVRRLNGIEPGFDAFWQQQSASTTLGLVKDSRYLAWRYRDQPHSAYQIWGAFEAERLLGFTVLKHEPPASQICELLVYPARDEVIDALVVSAGQQARETGSLVLSAWSGPAQASHDRLRRLGFVSMNRLHQVAHRWAALARRFYQVIVYVQHLPSEHQQQLLRAARRWPLALGDSDLS